MSLRSAAYRRCRSFFLWPSTPPPSQNSSMHYSQIQYNFLYPQISFTLFQSISEAICHSSHSHEIILKHSLQHPTLIHPFHVAMTFHLALIYCITSFLFCVIFFSYSIYCFSVIFSSTSPSLFLIPKFYLIHQSWLLLAINPCYLLKVKLV